jgi:hypothetical protein
MRAGRAPVKSAILATDSTIVHYARLLAVLTQGSSINVHVFQQREEAARWLGVPIELLTAEGSVEKHPDRISSATLVRKNTTHEKQAKR